MFLKQSDIANLTGEDLKRLRTRLGWTTARVAEEAKMAAKNAGLGELKLSQQTVSGYEQGTYKRQPGWLIYALEAMTFQLHVENEGLASMRSRRDKVSDDDLVNSSVFVEALPTYAGAGGGGTGEGDVGRISFSSALVHHQLRAAPADLLAIEIEGNSMDPDFQSGDQLLIDKRKVSLAQPGAFCLWDGDGYVVKYLEKVPGSDPAKIRVISRNSVFSTSERLADEVQILGRVVWFARQV